MAETVRHVHKLLATPEARCVKLIILVGGFAESQYLQERVRKEFDTPSCPVLVAMEPGFAVNKGAAYFGLFPASFIAQRVARFSYGICVSSLYDPAIHHPATINSVPQAGGASKIYSDNVLEPAMLQGTRVSADQCVEVGHYTPVSNTEEYINIRVFRVDGPIPRSGKRMYVLKDGWKAQGVLGVSEDAMLGMISVRCWNKAAHPELTRLERGIIVEMYFGRSELRVKATGKKTGDVQTKSMTFT